MKYLVFLLSTLSFTLNLYSQSLNWTINARKAYLPSAHSDVEVYYPKKGVVRHYYNSHFSKRKGKTKKLKDSATSEVIEFVQKTMRDSTYSIHLNQIISDSLDLEFLTDQNLLKDSMIVINFPLFERKFFMATMFTCDTCAFAIPIVRFQDVQINGERLIVNVKLNNKEILSLNNGVFESANIRHFKEWIIVYESHNRFGLFKKLNLEDYFSKENLTFELQRYVTALKR